MRARTAAGIFSGRLWSEAGRQVRSIAGRPARRVSATSSWASAPQPMTSGARMVERPSGDTAATILDERGCGLDRDRGVAAVRVRADGLAELLVERRTADQDDVVVADPPLDQLG